MQTAYKRLSVILGFVLLLILLVANAIIIRRQVGVQVADQVWVQHTQLVLTKLAEIESLLTQAETGQRGFLYTEDPKYLADYQLASTEAGPQIDALAALTADNPRQQQRIPELRDLTHAKLAELDETIRLHLAGHSDEARALVKSDQGFNLMKKIRVQMDEMSKEESELAQQRNVEYQKSIRITVICIYLACAVAGLGAIFLAIYIIREIELRETHARLMLEREEWFRSTLTSLGDAVIATDEKGTVTFLNPVAEELMGIRNAVAEGKPITEVFPIFNESTHLPVENPVRKVMEAGRVVGLANHTVLLRPDGTYVAIEDSAAPIRDGRGKLVGVVLVFRDASVDRKAQELLRKSEKLAAAARLSATVAHEINNPLEAIGNLIYLVKGTPDMPPSAVAQLGQAEQELERVSHITRQTLGFFRESKTPELVDIPSLVESVLRIYNNKFTTKQLTVDREFDECPPTRGLAGELKQVVANLISNAADAACDHGMIRVKLTCHEEGNKKTITLSIEDDGPGILPEHRDKIFEPFFTTKKDVGTGLGLWVTKEIVERHSGTIEVVSRADGSPSGTTFTVSLPVGAEVQPYNSAVSRES